MFTRTLMIRFWSGIQKIRKMIPIRLFILPWFVFTVSAFIGLFMPMSFIPPFAEFTSTDEISSYLLTKAIIENHSLAITKYASTLQIEHPYDLIIVNDEVYSHFLPGHAFIGVPFYILGKFIAQRLNLEGIILERFLFFCTCQVNVLSSAYTVFLVYKVCKLLGASEKSSFLSAYTFAFATINLVYARSFFSHSLGAMLVLYSFFIVLRIIKDLNVRKSLYIL